MDASRMASGRFARGYSCAQAIFSSFAEEFGIQSELALRLSAPFGGGMARQGEVCGALSGALMVLGLRYAESRPEGKEQTYRITREFIDIFRARHGALLCRELLGHDISTPAGLKAAKDENVFADVCPVLVEETARALTKFLSDHPRP